MIDFDLHLVLESAADLHGRDAFNRLEEFPDLLVGIAPQLAPQAKRITDKLRTAERDLAEAEADYEARKQQELVGIGETVIGFFFGRRSSRALSSAASKRRMTSKAKGKISESQEEVEELRREISKLEAELKTESEEITRKWDSLLENLTSEELAPRRTDVNLKLTSLAWLPSWFITYTDGRGSHTATVVAYALPEAQ